MYLSLPTYAKLNLCLHITGHRPDGYHELESLVMFAATGDMLSIAPGEEIALYLAGPEAKGLSTTDNLVFRAAQALARHGNITSGAKLLLDKHLPISSGIGGGSGDAAAALQLLNLIWELDFPPETLSEIGLSLGADIPVCLSRRACIMRGVGERLQPVTAPPIPLYALLVNPRVPLATAEVFRTYATQEKKYTPPHPLLAQERYTADEWWQMLHSTHNDLQAAAIRICPEIDVLVRFMERLEGCQLARMSGSGATCFGLFTDERMASAALGVVQSALPKYWASVAPLLS